MFQSKPFGISLRTSLILALIAIAPVVNAATNIVTTAVDGGPGSLRYVLANAATNDTIIFAPELSGAIIMLTNSFTPTGAGLSVTKSVTIDASALPGGIQINGNHNGSVIVIEAGASIFNGLTITNGYVSGSASTLGFRGDGGGILNYAALTLNQCRVVGNMALPWEGASGRSPGEGGAGICNLGTLTLNQCTIASNTLSSSVYNGGTLTVNNSTFVGNDIANSRSCYWCSVPVAYATVNQSTFSGNGSGLGSAATNVIFVNQSTFANGAGISGNIAISNSIVARPIYPAVTQPDSANNLFIADASLSPLGYYGGPTPTMPPLLNSPAIDAGSDIAANLFTTDQRGSPRFSGLHVDIGAVESAFPPGSPLVITQPAINIGLSFATVSAAVSPHGVTNTVCYFQYGPTTNYGSVTTNMTLGASAVTLSNTLTGLPSATLFHFRAVATNSLGTTFGDDLHFHTYGWTNIVYNTNDAGLGSLRDAVDNFVVGDSPTILFANNISGKIIVLTNGPITIRKSLNLDASSLPAGLTIDANTNGPAFYVTTSNLVVLTSLTITNGKNQFGGGIRNDGTLTLNKCTVTGNTAPGSGGGIYNGGTLTVNQCAIRGNTGLSSGGIANIGTLTVNQSTLSGNSSTYEGGGIVNTTAAGLVLNQSTLSGNSAGVGGALYNTGNSAIVNQCTLSGNSASDANGGGGIYNWYLWPIVVSNSIIAGNTGATNPDVRWEGGVPSSITLWSVNLTNGNPMLAPLGNYGGPTLTMPPLPGSPAIDACTNGTSFTLDQRGFPRVADGNGDTIAIADIGATEGVSAPDGPGVLTAVRKTGGQIQFEFANATGRTFTVFASPDLAAPLNTWSNLGPAVEMPVGSGQYQFTDPGATNAQRFYRVRSP